MLIDDSKFPTQHPPDVYVACVGLEALIVPKYLRCAGSRHGGNKQAVAHAVRRNVGPQLLPVPPRGGGVHLPHVVLQHAPADRATLEVKAHSQTAPFAPRNTERTPPIVSFTLKH